MADKPFRMPPNPMEEIRAWAQKHRSDILPQLLEIEQGQDVGPGPGLMFLLAIGFSAGRRYQHLNPDHDPL